MPMITNQTQLERLGINDFKRHPHHAREISPKHLERIENSIRALGFQGAIIIDEETRHL